MRTSCTTGPRQTGHSPARGHIGLDTASLGATYVNVSWNWIKAASGYRVQLAKKSDFSELVTTRKKGTARTARPVAARRRWSVT